ncbi:hypothetical protein G7072_09295 [Nocardioides sp. HDW12B]|uniref:hypothetical protein n=1 Tax=Nocardioides sp. HDW12B TaxID=2714939 RepID=UPI001408B750|nr:hypothetical protein [Nocardioides sp. HDW12B]QIK66520.1 hypothetical protein G7072_09295 [Nocardioides sp. HDW12B]
MFIQVIQGPCTRHDELRALAESWRTEMAPHAPGWLGGTYGFTDDDMFIGVVRFESREAAMANSDRPEQAAWAERMRALMDGPVEFHDCDDVTLFLDGGSDEAGFVQVIRGRVSDPERAKAMLAEASMLRDLRPEIIGGTLALEADGTFIETVAFTDEASARQGEQTAAPAEVEDRLRELLQDARFYDLHHPWFASAP